jgi:hypothetical protein
MDQKLIEWKCKKAYRRVLRAACSTLYRETNQDIRRSAIIAGTGRSGTTWLADIVASQIPCRLMFEPFHPRQVEAFERFHYFQYMRPDERNDELWSYCHTVLSGSIRHRWIDRQVERILPKSRLIKEIRANLFLKWIHNQFPEVPILFIVRHPCAVVLSRMRLTWATDSDIAPLLAQDKLVADYLGDRVDLIRSAKSLEKKHAIVWCISNLVPLHQFQPHELTVIFYENLCVQPEIEVPRAFRALGHDYRASAMERSRVPSTTTVRSSAILTGKDRVTSWRDELTPKQIEDILSIVEAFQLEHLYGDSSTPIVKNVSE